MPLGYYLAQGLIPLGPSSSDDEEGPCELPDGRTVCGPHGLTICGKCCVDYSYLDESLSDGSENESNDEEEDENRDTSQVKPFKLYPLVTGHFVISRAPHSNNQPTTTETLPSPAPSSGPTWKRGSGQVFPTKFVPPSASVTPLELFSGRKAHMLVTRYTLPNDPGKGLVYTDGACLNNGHADPKAGWAFWHGYRSAGEPLVASGRLEKKGPFGDDGAQTSNRAELRAIIAPLRFRHWPGEGFHTLVVATDSEYAVEGATKWAKTWVKNGWKRRTGRLWDDVKNRDLWEALLGEIERYKSHGMAVEFWRIPREWNTVADAAAKGAAAQFDVPNEWRELYGIDL